MVRAVGCLEIDATPQCIARTDIEFAAIEPIKQSPRLAISRGAGLAVLQLPLAGRLIIRHFNDEDHVRRMIGELARLQQGLRLFDGLS